MDRRRRGALSKPLADRHRRTRLAGRAALHGPAACDAVTLGRQHIRNSIATLRTEKSQGMVVVTLPILSVLATTLAAGPCADLAFICGSNGKRLTKESFGNMFREACNAANVVGKSAHGVRKIGATRAADNSATVLSLKRSLAGRAAVWLRSTSKGRIARRHRRGR